MKIQRGTPVVTGQRLASPVRTRHHLRESS